MEKTESDPVSSGRVKVEGNSPLLRNSNQILNSIVALGSMDKLMEFCSPIAKSGISPFNKPEDVAAVALWAIDKNINLIDALANTFVLNGRASINSHIIRGLLLKAGIIHKMIKNYEREYTYSYKDQVFSQKEIDESPDRFVIFYNMEAIRAYMTAQKESTTKDFTTPILRSELPVDIATEIEFTRYFGSRKHTYVSRFTIQEATAAGLINKSNWVNYPQLCLSARAYVIGAREIGSDIIFGLYNPDEIGFTEIQNIDLDDTIEHLEVN